MWIQLELLLLITFVVGFGTAEDRECSDTERRRETEYSGESPALSRHDRHSGRCHFAVRLKALKHVKEVEVNVLDRRGALSRLSHPSRMPDISMTPLPKFHDALDHLHDARRASRYIAPRNAPIALPSSLHTAMISPS